MRPTTPCEHNPSQWTDPHPDTTPAAIKACGDCPLLTECARLALTAGTTLDKQLHAPAHGVIQAGIECRGDEGTAQQLATIAGQPLPFLGKRAKLKRPTHCRGCGKVMVARPKGRPLPPDLITHAAHGYCRVCDARRRRQSTWENPTPTLAQILT